MSVKPAQSGAEKPATDELSAESLGRQLRSLLPPLRLQSLSLCNAAGDVLWLSEGSLGPDEHSVVLDALQSLTGEPRHAFMEAALEDGRFAMFLAVRTPRDELVGAVMLMTDGRNLPPGTKELLAGARIRNMLQRIAMFLRVVDRAAADSAAYGEPAAAASATQLDEILTLEIKADPDATVLAPPLPQRESRRTAAPVGVSDDATVIAPAHLITRAVPDAQATAPALALIAEDTVVAPSLPPSPKPRSSEPGVSDDATVIAPAQLMARGSLVAKAPAAPAAQSAADAAADLSLSVQELVKMRSSGRTRRYEVLARSRREAARNEAPSVFASTQTSAPDGVALDNAVVGELMQWLQKHPQIWDGEPASFSINVSVGTLEDAAFLATFAKALATAGVPASSIGFEITEFACKQSRSCVQRFVATCERLGCFVVLDNFTFDSAAVPLLASKAVRMVKIDPKLTTLAMKEKLPQAVVIAILQACKVLGVHCIAKNVETQAALEWLEAIGCDFAQGFALERPLSLESLAAPSPSLPRARGKEGKVRR